MKKNTFSGLRSVIPVSAICMATAACQPGLIYGERNSLSIASVNLNDDVSEPVKVKVGFNRTLASSAPPRGGEGEEQTVNVPDGRSGEKSIKVRGGEAVSVFSKFFLENDNKGQWMGIGDELTIVTNFASGQAAIDISGNKEVVAALLNARTIGPESEAIVDRKRRLAVCVDNETDPTKINTIASRLGVQPTPNSPKSTKTDVKEKIRKMNPNEIDAAENIDELKSCS
jgi:hypothetical protein